jgi:hypothetical protein
MNVSTNLKCGSLDVRLSFNTRKDLGLSFSLYCEASNEICGTFMLRQVLHSLPYSSFKQVWKVSKERTVYICCVRYCMVVVICFHVVFDLFIFVFHFFHFSLSHFSSL